MSKILEKILGSKVGYKIEVWVSGVGIIPNKIIQPKLVDLYIDKDFIKDNETNNFLYYDREGEDYNHIFLESDLVINNYSIKFYSYYINYIITLKKCLSQEFFINSIREDISSSNSYLGSKEVCSISLNLLEVFIKLSIVSNIINLSFSKNYHPYLKFEFNHPKLKEIKILPSEKIIINDKLILSEVEDDYDYNRVIDIICHRL